MKTILKALSAVALTGVMVLPVLADDATTTNDGTDSKDLKKVIEDQGINYVQTAQKGITLSGFVDTSYTEQFAGRTVPFVQGATGTVPNTANLRQFDTQADGFNIQAVKIALEQALPSTNTWGAGFRIDTIYGEDAKFLADSPINSVAPGTNSGTANASGLALEQALVKFRIPVGNGLDIYAGKFVTFLGYEVIESPANPNFSRGLLFTNAIPLTHTGVYADYKFNDTLEAKFGVVDGWNNSSSPANSDLGIANSDEAFGGKAITGQLNINAPGKNANITQSFIYSPNSELDIANPSATDGSASTTAGIVVYDIWGNWNPTFDKNGNTTLGFNIDYGYDSFSWYGVALYAQYKLTKTITLAGRGEYLHADANANKFGAGGTFTGAFVPTTGIGAFVPEAQDDYSITATISFAVWDNLLTRAEYRLDDLSASTTGTSSSVQNEISLEAVYSF